MGLGLKVMIQEVGIMIQSLKTAELINSGGLRFKGHDPRSWNNDTIAKDGRTD